MRITAQNTNAAIYLRLSREDEKEGKKEDDSSSILTQRSMLTKYAHDNGISVVGEYVDDGFSGTTFNRPGFQRMMEDIETGKIDCVIVKDRSRLGRNYIEVGQFTDYYFPEHGIRFIAVDNNIDSANGDSDIAPFLDIVNEWYAKDISKKIKSAYRNKFNNGGVRYINVPFGYKQDPDNKSAIIIDDETAPIVRGIFDMALTGKGAGAIANVLIDKRIPVPSAWQYKRFGYYARKYDGADESVYYSWERDTVRKILTDEIYIGTAVHYKEGNVSHKNHKKIRRSESEHMRVEGVAPAIVTKEEFDTIKRMVESRTRTAKYKYRNLFGGMLVCPDCGRTLSTQFRPENNPRSQVFFVCPTYSKHSKVMPHSSHYIRHYVLEAEVLKQVQMVCAGVRQYEAEFADVLRQKSRAEDTSAKTAAELAKAERRMDELDTLLMQLYEDKISGKLSARNFDSFSAKYQAEQSDLEKKIEELKSILESKKEEDDNMDQFSQIVKSYTDPQELTPELLHALIDKIIVGETVTDADGNKTQEIEIVWRCIGTI